VNYAGDGNYNAATQVTINLAIKQVTPAVTWPTPAAITYGTPLSSTQLSATANVAGTFIYIHRLQEQSSQPGRRRWT